MNQFQKAIKDNEPILCDICGKEMRPIPGCGWENDRIICIDHDNCGAEIVYPTST